MTSTTTVSRLVKAPRAAVYRSCLDPVALAAWRVPDGMTATVHELDPWPGGQLWMSLAYLNPGASPAGKTAEGVDTFRSRFLELAPGERVVEAVEFETEDPDVAGTMTLTTSLRDVEGGTLVTLHHEGIPPGVRPADNELGTAQALARLAALLE